MSLHNNPTVAIVNSVSSRSRSYYHPILSAIRSAAATADHGGTARGAEPEVVAFVLAVVCQASVASVGRLASPGTKATRRYPDLPL